MTSYKIIFSIPVHEKYEVILDQCLNFHFFNPNSGIVLHFSKGFNAQSSQIDKNTFDKAIEKLDYVFINPYSVRTGWYDIIQAHISNFEFILKNNIDFDYFSLCASNELFLEKV